MAALGVLTVGSGVHSRWSHPCPANLGTLTAQKFSCEMSMCISTVQARTNRVSRRPLFRRSRFTSSQRAVLVSWAMSIFHCRHGTFGACCSLNRCFAWQVQDSRHFFIRVPAWQAWVKMRCFGGHFLWQAQFWWPWTAFWKDREFRFVMLSSNLIWDMMMIPCGNCSTSDASGSFFVPGAELCRPRQRSARNLGKTLSLTFSYIFNVHFSWCAQCFVKI